MKHYKSYMDRVTVDDKLHNRLLDLEEPQKTSRRPAWAKYGALAACAALLIGVGVYAAGNGAWSRLTGEAHFAPEPLPSADWGGGPLIDQDPIMSAETIDLAPVDGDDILPGMKTIPGFEVRENRAGVDVVVYHVLPWIDYGSKDAEGVSQTAPDYDLPEDATFRTLTHGDVLALVGGEQALETFLDWGGFAFTGSATFDADGTVWQMGFSGKRGDCFFQLELAPDALPRTCVITEPHTTTEIWGVEVTSRYSGIYGEGPDREVWMPESREVEFVANGVGCRFTLYGLEGQSEAVETMVSRFVRHAILEGLNLSAVGPEESSAPVDNGPDAPWDTPYEEEASPAPSRSAVMDGEASPSRGPAVP